MESKNNTSLPLNKKLGTHLIDLNLLIAKNKST